MIRKTTWNTYKTTCYTHDVANDQASAGGVHHYQVRSTKFGWQERICQTNGNHYSYGPVTEITEAEGEAHWADIQQEQETMVRREMARRRIFNTT